MIMQSLCKEENIPYCQSSAKLPVGRSSGHPVLQSYSHLVIWLMVIQSYGHLSSYHPVISVISVILLSHRHTIQSFQHANKLTD